MHSNPLNQVDAYYYWELQLWIQSHALKSYTHAGQHALSTLHLFSGTWMLHWTFQRIHSHWISQRLFPLFDLIYYNYQIDRYYCDQHYLYEPCEHDDNWFDIEWRVRYVTRRVDMVCANKCDIDCDLADQKKI